MFRDMDEVMRDLGENAIQMELVSEHMAIIRAQQIENGIHNNEKVYAAVDKEERELENVWKILQHNHIDLLAELEEAHPDWRELYRNGLIN